MRPYIRLFVAGLVIGVFVGAGSFALASGSGDSSTGELMAGEGAQTRDPGFVDAGEQDPTSVLYPDLPPAKEFDHPNHLPASFDWAAKARECETIDEQVDQLLDQAGRANDGDQLPREETGNSDMCRAARAIVAGDLKPGDYDDDELEQELQASETKRGS